MGTGIKAIVDRQVSRWEAEGRARLERQRRSSERLAPEMPVLTISREHGSMGARIGRLAADMLGFEFFDRNLVEIIAARSKARRALIESLDEAGPKRIDEYLSGLMSTRTATPTLYLRHLLRVVFGLAEHGRVVIVGRGAHCIVPEDAALRVRFVAPLPLRISRIAELRGISRDEARREIAQVDRERNKFVQKNLGGDPKDVHNFDLVINTGQVSLRDAAEIAAIGLKRKFELSDEDLGVTA